MSEQETPLDVPFSTDDHEGIPAFTFRERRLTVAFLDWRARQVRVVFSEVAGVKWQSLGESGPNGHAFEVVQSAWLAVFLSNGWTTADRLRHFRIYFDGRDTLDVLAENMLSEVAG